MEYSIRTLFGGTVQGVGFRFTARGLAQRFVVTGYVRNLQDGRVEVVACGGREEVRAYLAALRGRMADYIATEEADELSSCPRCETFDIRF